MIMKHIEPQAIKLFGSYPQLQQGLFMQRIPVYAGVINVGQLRAIAGIAQKHTPDTPLHLTTRQNIEFHNVKEADQMSLHREIMDLGYNTFGAGGDSVRNITICPCCKYDANAWNPQPLADKTKSALNNSGLLTSMSRKFKLTFSGCSSPQSKPYITDFGVLVTSSKTATIVCAGSLGPSPQAGIVLYENLSVVKVPALALALLRLFVDHGDRENRRKARLRHIRQRMGDESFRKLVDEYFAQTLNELGELPVELCHGLPDMHKAGTFQAVAGNIDSTDLLLLCDAVEKADAKLQINLQQGIEVYAHDDFEFPAEIQCNIDQPVIMACPGNTTCKNGIVNVPAMAVELSERLRAENCSSNKTVAISGCPNNCMHSCVSDIGLTGRIITVESVRHEAYNILTGGENGLTPQFSQKIDLVIAKELSDKVSELYK